MRSSRYSKSKGLTLVEVIASLALLSTVLVTVLLSWSRNTAQLSTAHKQTRALELLDQQIAEWYGSADGIPLNEQGVFEADSTFAWRTKLISAKSSNPDWKVATVQIAVATRLKPSRVLARVELLVNMFESPTTSSDRP